jgi:hypothetical protein
MLDHMDNSNRDSQDNWPTQQPGPAGGQGPGQSGGGKRRTGRATRWGIGIAAVAILIGGGTAALVASGNGGSASLASSSSPADQAGQATPNSQAAVLNTVLSSADSPTAAGLTATWPAPGRATAAAKSCARLARRLRAAKHQRAANAVRAHCRSRIARVRLLLHGIHGQFTFETKQGAKTIAFERGTIQSVTGSSVTVTAADGTTWTWHLVSNTVVRQDHKKVAEASLATGQRVFAGGPVVSGADNARLIVIRPAASASAPASSASAPAS